MADKPRVKAPKQRTTHTPDDAARRKRLLLVGGVAIAALVVVVGAFAFLGVGGGEASEEDVRTSLEAAGCTLEVEPALAGAHSVRDPGGTSDEWNTDPPLQSATVPAQVAPAISAPSDATPSHWPAKHNSVATKPPSTSSSPPSLPGWSASGPSAVPTAAPPLQSSNGSSGMADSWSPAHNPPPLSQSSPTNTLPTTGEAAPKIQGWPEDLEQNSAPATRDEDLPFNRAARAMPYGEQPAAETARRELPAPSGSGGTRFDGTVLPLNPGTDYR